MCSRTVKIHFSRANYRCLASQLPQGFTTPDLAPRSTTWWHTDNDIYKFSSVSYLSTLLQNENFAIFVVCLQTPTVCILCHDELRWLDVLERVTYKMGVMMYHCLHGQAPRYLADHFTTSSDVAYRLRLWSANRHQLTVPRCRLNTYGHWAFSIAGPTVWNSLPDKLRDPVCGSDSFKQFLKTILFSLY